MWKHIQNSWQAGVLFDFWTRPVDGEIMMILLEKVANILRPQIGFLL